MSGHYRQKISSFLLAGILLLSVAGQVRALDLPNFPTCPNPGGTVIANYPSGVHGIAGSTLTYTGSDVVYKIDDSKVVQCYCSPNGSGIQTNWWKASSLTSKQKADLIATGWVYIPDGSEWGLDPSDWMAYNISFTCGGSTTTTTTSSSSNSNSGSSSSSSSSNSIISLIPSILGFADTGRMLFWRRLFFVTGLICMIAALAAHFVRTTPRQPKRR